MAGQGEDHRDTPRSLAKLTGLPVTKSGLMYLRTPTSGAAL